MATSIPIKLHTRPQLNNPSLIAAWGCIGNVGLLATRYLVERLEAKELGEIESERFFYPREMVIRPGGSQDLALPQSRLYYTTGGTHDLILCLADEEPPLRRKEYAKLLVDLALELGAHRIYTVCARTLPLHHTTAPRVQGVVNNPTLVTPLESCGVLPIDESTFRSAPSMNRLLLHAASTRSVEAVYLLGEVPEYTAAMLNPRTSRAVLQALSDLLELPLDLSGMDELTQRIDAEIETILAEMAERGKRDEKLRRAYETIQALKGLEPDRSRFQRSPAAETPEEKRILELLTQAEQAPTQAAQLKKELAELTPPQRLAILKKYRRRLLDMLGE